MKGLARVAGAALALGAFGCSEDPAGVTAADLVGLWGAWEVVYTSDADAATRVDLVNDVGATYSIEFHATGTYHEQVSEPGRPARSETGAYDVSQGQLVLDPDEGERRELTIVRTASGRLSVREEGVAYDFDGDGVAEPAALELTLDQL